MAVEHAVGSTSLSNFGTLNQLNATEPTLRCKRCGAVGHLTIDPSNPVHLEILRIIQPGTDPSGNSASPTRASHSVG